jgi:hypothetical protein
LDHADAVATRRQAVFELTTRKVREQGEVDPQGLVEDDL